MSEVARTYGTPRRTILLESAGGTATAVAEPLEIVDTPCWALLSGTGLLARTADGAAPVRAGRRSAHDVVVAAVPATTRADVGAVTSRGRALRLHVLDLPGIPPTDGPPSMSGGIPVSEVLDLSPGETVLGLMSLAPDAPTLALGTASGVVKRVAQEAPPSRDTWEVISLRDGDEVVGAAAVTDADTLVFVASDAQLLHFPASAVRPQGRPAGGMAGIKLSAGQRAIFFGAVPADAGQDATVVTVAGAPDALPGTQAGTAKVTPFTAFPGKGRATGGVRAHRFLRGEDCLILSWVGPTPARASGSAGQPIDLPEIDERRDMSGRPLPAPLHTIG
jgi:DNA gyrase subunit A